MDPSNSKSKTPEPGTDAYWSYKAAKYESKLNDLFAYKAMKYERKLKSLQHKNQTANQQPNLTN